METEMELDPLPSLYSCFTRRSTLLSLAFTLTAGCLCSFFVTFILNRGLIDPNAFFNRFFKFWYGYLLLIPGLGLVWGVVLSFVGIYFRGYLSPRLFRITNQPLRLAAIGLSGFALAFLGLMVIYHVCLGVFNLPMWSRQWNLSVALLGGLFGTAFAFLFYLDYENKVLLQKAEFREGQLTRYRLEGELMTLNLRIRPHFFFNALNTLASLIDKDREVAQEFLADLADLFRLSFTHGQDNPICRWHEEKAIITAYMTVEKMRFLDRLQWQLEVDAPDEAPFPAFLLQPLVENAVHHGVSRSQTQGYVHIAGGFTAGAWHIVITNSLSGPARLEIEKGHALWTIRERLNLIGGRIQLSADEREFKAELHWSES